MKKISLIKLLGLGIYTILKASIPLNGHCPTAENYVSNYSENMKYKIPQQDTINLKKSYLFYDSCKEN
jgi:hypothetical protein